MESTRTRTNRLADEMGWTLSTKRDEDRDFYWAHGPTRRHYVTIMWTPEGELATIWLNGVESSAAEFTENGTHGAEYLLTFVFDLKLAAEGSLNY